MTFCYKTSTDSELLQHILTSSSATISVAKKYHTDHNNLEIVKRIDTARKVLKQRRVLEQLVKLHKDTEGFGV